MFCANCGTKMNDEDLFCGNCGWRNVQANDPNQSTQAFNESMADVPGDNTVNAAADFSDADTIAHNPDIANDPTVVNDADSAYDATVVSDTETEAFGGFANEGYSQNSASAGTAQGYDASEDTAAFTAMGGANQRQGTNNQYIRTGNNYRGQGANYAYDNQTESMAGSNYSGYEGNGFYSENGSEFIPTPEETKSNKALIITISVCAFVLIALIGVLVYILVFSGGDGDVPKQKPKSESKTTVEDIITDSDGEDIPPVKAPEDYVKIENSDINSIISYDTSDTRYGIYVMNLKNDYEYAYNADDIFLSSAMSQVVILDTVFKECEDNGIDMNTATMRFNYLKNGKEVPGSANQDGQDFSIMDYVNAVAEYGDNNRSNQLVDYIGEINGTDDGFSIIRDRLDSQNYTNTHIQRKIYTSEQEHLIDESRDPNTTTASDMAHMFKDFIGKWPQIEKRLSSVDRDGDALGFRKYLSDDYRVYNVNAINTRCSNNVAVIKKGDTELIVCILAETSEGTATQASQKQREPIIENLINHVVKTQFEQGDVQ